MLLDDFFEIIDGETYNVADGAEITVDGQPVVGMEMRYDANVIIAGINLTTKKKDR